MTQAATHLKVAVTTNSLINIDAGFADARQIVFYEVTRDGSAFVDAVNVATLLRKDPAPGESANDTPPVVTPKPGFGRNGGACQMAADLAADSASGDLLTARIKALSGCSILVTRGISDLAAVRCQDADIFPVKTERLHDIDSVLDRLQTLLAGRPPLWLRRALRDANGRAVPLDDQAL
ncbi:Nitrogen fixation protein [Rhodovastum atsumiense]|uniref:Nitrogen fixation protein n=1 Tax=Rhodovastum atsumiense TaxID=504468 RepID=A0A5M6J1H1_9PROT|nr:nitrogen fixation protein [Rhodovastum atsumiense]KAA5614059.1 nitrogen fixation protein [Rhodovastum atsumiense]CAH2598874.1 Nitrogen fixation protein [Rhodovastum atsumiense]